MARILEAPLHAYRVHPVDEFGLLVDAADYYRAFYRAAERARRYILLSGWQFDRDVALLRGEDAERVDGPVALLKFLNYLCETRPELEIYILAWDFNLVFAAEREWMQSLVFHWTTHERLRFRFDSNHVERGCHHQKFVVLDGAVSFLGGLDLCDDRWDDRAHRQHNALRLTDGEPHKPFHDIQAYLRGAEVARSLAELFAWRWERAGGAPFTLPDRVESDLTTPATTPHPEGLVPLAARSVALSRTDPYGAPGGPLRCAEILAQHQAAIAAAERLIYIETQYLSGHAIYQALAERMKSPGRSRLQIVMILNMRGETLKEQAAVGLAQAQIIGDLRRVAEETGHALGLYYTLPACDAAETPERATYIHAKLMIVDDRLLIVGSANLTNRSMAVDTELNASVEAERADDPLGRSIRAARASLLAEHTGSEAHLDDDTLVQALDKLADHGRWPACRLRRHPSPTESEKVALALVDPQELPFDPDQVEELDEDAKRDFVSGLGKSVRELFASKKDKG